MSPGCWRSRSGQVAKMSHPKKRNFLSRGTNSVIGGGIAVVTSSLAWEQDVAWMLAFQAGDRDLIQSVVEFSGKTVREAMKPRPETFAVPVETTVERFIEMLRTRSEYGAVGE